MNYVQYSRGSGFYSWHQDSTYSGNCHMFVYKKLENFSDKNLLRKIICLKTNNYKLPGGGFNPIDS